MRFMILVAARKDCEPGIMLKEALGVESGGPMKQLAAAMPEDKFSYKSTPPQRDFGQQVLHVAQVNFKILQAVGAKTPAPTIDLKATTKADILKAMDDSFDFGTAILKEQTDQTMLQPAAMPPGFMGPSSRAR